MEKSPRSHHKTISENELLTILKRKKSGGKTLRKIAEDYPRITYGDIQRCLAGHFPRDPRKRMSLGLSALAPAPVCKKCGVVHVAKRCTAARKPKHKTLISSSIAELLWLLEHREVL